MQELQQQIRLLRLLEEPPHTFARPQQPSCSENNLERNGGHGMCTPPPGKELGAGVDFERGGKEGGFTPPLRAEEGGAFSRSLNIMVSSPLFA